MEEKCIDGPSFEDIEFNIPFGHITGKWWGPKDQKPLIAIHGWRDNAKIFDPLIKLLPKNLSILCIDLPGHGRSSHIPQGFLNYLLWDSLTILRRLVLQHNWKYISIMGHSLGSEIGFLYAAIYPYDTNMIICIDTVAPIILEPSEIVNNIGKNLDKFLSFDELEQNEIPFYDHLDMIDLVEEPYNSTLAYHSDEISMKNGLYSLENGNHIFTRNPHYNKVSWMGLPSLDLIKEFAGHITCRYMNIKVKPYRSLDNWPVYSDILEIIKTNAKEFIYKEYNGNHYIHFNNPECIASDIANFILQKSPK